MHHNVAIIHQSMCWSSLKSSLVWKVENRSENQIQITLSSTHKNLKKNPNPHFFQQFFSFFILLSWRRFTIFGLQYHKVSIFKEYGNNDKEGQWWYVLIHLSLSNTRLDSYAKKNLIICLCQSWALILMNWCFGESIQNNGATFPIDWNHDIYLLLLFHF